MGVVKNRENESEIIMEEKVELLDQNSKQIIISNVNNLVKASRYLDSETIEYSMEEIFLFSSFKSAKGIENDTSADIINS